MKTVTQKDVDEAKELLAALEAEHAAAIEKRRGQEKPKPTAEQPKVHMVKKTVKGKTSEITTVENFLQVVGYRTAKIEDYCTLISKCTSRDYEYTQHNVDVLREKLYTSVDSMLHTLEQNLVKKPKTDKKTNTGIKRIVDLS